MAGREGCMDGGRERDESKRGATHTQKGIAHTSKTGKRQIRRYKIKIWEKSTWKSITTQETKRTKQKSSVEQ